MSETAKSFWHSAGYIPWFTADTASAVGAALRALAISLLDMRCPVPPSPPGGSERRR